VDEVVEDVHLEQAEQLRLRVVADEAEAVVVRRDPGHEAEGSDDEEDDADEERTFWVANIASSACSPNSRSSVTCRWAAGVSTKTSVPAVVPATSP
jgi:hypothetical protein